MTRTAEHDGRSRVFQLPTLVSREPDAVHSMLTRSVMILAYGRAYVSGSAVLAVLIWCIVLAHRAHVAVF